MDDGARVKAKDVALVANVSLSAVSRTFTPGASVSSRTRAKVMAAADAMGYRPNILARGLTTRRTQLVGVVMPRADSPFFEAFLSRLNHALAAEGQRMLLLLVESRVESDEALRQALDYSVDGLIFVSSAPSPGAVEVAARASVPLVVMDRGEGAPGVSYVWTDGASIGRKVADIFIAEGRTRPVAVTAFKGAPQPRELVSFIAAMEAATGQAAPLIEAGSSYDDGVAVANRLLSGSNPPDAIFTATDFVAIGVYDAARHQLGVEVPKDLSIIGVGDTRPTNWMSHAISTVRPPLDMLVRTAVSSLMARIADPSTPAMNSYIDCAIVRRSTTQPIPAPQPADRQEEPALRRRPPLKAGRRIRSPAPAS